MKQVSQAASTDLSLEERNLLSVAYKNVVGARRASLRIIGSIENKEEGKGDSEKVNLISSYKGKVEQEHRLHSAQSRVRLYGRRRSACRDVGQIVRNQNSLRAKNLDSLLVAVARLLLVTCNL